MKIKDLLKEVLQDDSIRDVNLRTLSIALEHEQYKNIPGTKNSYRVDSANTNTLTQRHAHVYAKRQGKGEELYSVNLDGTGHDGYSGTTIPASHAEYLRNIGFKIPENLSLESLEYEDLNPLEYQIAIICEGSINSNQL